MNGELPMRGERPIEKLARRIVADVLGLQVTQHDDNSRTSMVDALIQSPAGPIPLEVVMDVDPSVMKQSAQLSRYSDGIPLEEGAQSWFVMMRRGARTSRLASTLPPLLAALDPAANFDRTPRPLADLGVHAIAPITEPGRSVIFLLAQGVSYSGSGPDVNRYVEEFLQRADDVPYKLALATAAGRGHAFIWVTITSDYSGWAAIRDDDRPLPTSGPALPCGVTDIWLASIYVGRGVLRYSPERGWERTSRVITAEDEASLHEPR